MKITLKTLHLATAQQVFDQVAAHLLTQNKRSYNDELAACAYRSPDGLKCAAGCLIADEEYNPAWEGMYWLGLCGEFPVTTKWHEPLTDAHSGLIVELQKIHDNVEPNEWPISLESLAKECELEYNQEQYTKNNEQ